MADLFGRKYTCEEIYKRTGHHSQVCGIKEYTFNSGKAKGVDAVDVDAGDLKFTVLNSRCLDIGQTTYKGLPIGYIAKSGLCSPAYFVENHGKGFLDSFYGGLLTTSGLNNIGVPCNHEGKDYGLHGEIANIPAEKVSVKEYWQDDELHFEVSGEVRHSRFFGEDLLLTRTVKTSLGSNKLTISDSVQNRDFANVPLMLLYHINIGFPFLDASSKLIIPERKQTWPRTESAKKGLDAFDSFTEPVDGIGEECFYHTFNGDKALVCLFNPSLGKRGMGVYLKYDVSQLPVFLQWKTMRSREYVCGFAPATNYAEGRKDAIENNKAILIEPLEKRDFQIEIGVIEDLSNLQGV